MKIALLSPVTWRTPPRNYGPWEQVASVLTEALVEMGVEVTLFATGDSITKGKLNSVIASPLGEFPGDAKVAECLHISSLMEKVAEFDLIHNHFDFLPLTYSRLIDVPMVTTIHGFSSPLIVPVYKKYNIDSYYVSISRSDRHPDLDYAATIYNGIDDNLFQWGSGQGQYLLYFGRIHPDKGTAEAIQIAQQTGLKLIIAGLIQDAEYYRSAVEPHIDQTLIQFVGNVGPEQRNTLMGNALALLHPIRFEEPFGLSVVESMMCGTPVIAFRRGSMEELILDGNTGFLVESVEEAARAVRHLGLIDRIQCRQHALKNFGRLVMANQYRELYTRIIKDRAAH